MTLQNNLFDYLTVFGAGVFLSFSPCVYPLIPVTVGIIAKAAENSKARIFLLTQLYVLGLAISYSCLGLIAALSGKLFGTIARSPLSNFVVGIIFILLGLSLLGVFRLPTSIFKFPDRLKNKGNFSVLFLGFVSGLAISPCVTPVLASILVYIASRQNILYGASLLFVFAWGLGFVLILAGIFSGFIMNLPKVGIWMVWINKLCGLILIGLGGYFLIQIGGILR